MRQKQIFYSYINYDRANSQHQEIFNNLDYISNSYGINLNYKCLTNYAVH